jgi:hypothetical protein
MYRGCYGGLGALGRLDCVCDKIMAWGEFWRERSAVAKAEGMPGAVGGPAAVDGEGVAVDEAALSVVGEEGDGGGDVAG